MKILCRRGEFKDTEKSFSVGTDIVFGISVPESIASSTEMPNIPSSEY